MRKGIIMLFVSLFVVAGAGFAQVEEVLLQADSNVSVMDKKARKRYLKELEKNHEEEGEKKENFIKRTWHKVFPKKVEREVSYHLMYQEKPKTIMVMYPWNRSKEQFADEMFYVSVCKELVNKGYYVLPALPALDAYKADTMFNSRYCEQSDSRKYLKSHGVDAVLYITIYSVKKEWWTTNVNMNAQYDLISTKTGETLFSRHSDFNYDSQLPPKSKSDNGLISDEKENNYLGISEQMQTYTFSDFPIGPYHKDYLMDQKKFSHKKEMKYKVKIKPS